MKWILNLTLGVGTITLGAATGYPARAGVSIFNNTARGWTIAPNGVTSFTLYPGQACRVSRTGSTWSVVNDFRWQTRTAVTFYVNHATGSNANDGLTSGSAFATIQKAIDVIEANVDCLVNGPTIQVAAGTFTEVNVVHTKRLTGNHVIYIVGDGATPSNCVWQVSSGQTGMQCRDWSGIIINGFKFVQPSGTGATFLSSSQHGVIDVWNIEFGACAGGIHIASVNGGSVGYVAGATPSITGSAVYHWYCVTESALICSGVTYAVAGSLTFTSFLSVHGGSVTLAGLTFSGAGAGAGLTGYKYQVTHPSTVILGGTTLPGATAGGEYTQPLANDGGALGAAGQAYSDLFLASGGTISFNSGNVLLTHVNSSSELRLSVGSFSIPSGRLSIGMTGPVVDLTVHTTANEIARFLTNQTLGYFQIFNSNGANALLIGGSGIVGFFQNTSGTEIEMQIAGGGATAKLRAGEVSAQSDHGGKASYISLTGISDLAARSTGVGTIKFDDATARDNAGFVKIYVGTTAYYVPIFAAI